METAVHRVGRLRLAEHRFEVPVDHNLPSGPTLDVFAREVTACDRAWTALPWLVYFEGGPGHEAPRPLPPEDPPWLERALDEYRVLLLDQRGVGCSSPVHPEADPEAQAATLAHYRADSIVRDAELIRRELSIDRWSVIGQSFGGFCITTYLSLFPEALVEAMIAGGLPPLDLPIDAVYPATYERVAEYVARYYGQYPHDRKRIGEILDRLASEDVLLPSGDVLSPRRFRQLGHLLGMHNGSERLHYIVELPIASHAFLHDVERALPFSRNPLYAVIHEACYAPAFPTNWAAERLLPTDFADDETLLFGEHVFPWMFEEYGTLRPFSQAADILAKREWGPLYDVDKLAANEVPTAAVIYVDDMYVPRQHSELTAARIQGLKAWITNEYRHDGLSAGRHHVFERLLTLARNPVY